IAQLRALRARHAQTPHRKPTKGLNVDPCPPPRPQKANPPATIWEFWPTAQCPRRSATADYHHDELRRFHDSRSEMEIKRCGSRDLSLAGHFGARGIDFRKGAWLQTNAGQSARVSPAWGAGCF